MTSKEGKSEKDDVRAWNSVLTVQIAPFQQYQSLYMWYYRTYDKRASGKKTLKLT